MAELNFKTMTQTNVTTDKSRAVRRSQLAENAEGAADTHTSLGAVNDFVMHTLQWDVSQQQEQLNMYLRMAQKDKSKVSSVIRALKAAHRHRSSAMRPA